jgi:hypothetical protein
MGLRDACTCTRRNAENLFYELHLKNFPNYICLKFSAKGAKNQNRAPFSSSSSFSLDRHGRSAQCRPLTISPRAAAYIEILGLEGESMNEKWTINPCRQGKLNLGVIPADRLGCFLLKTFFLVFIKWGSLSMSAGVNPMNFWLI